MVARRLRGLVGGDRAAVVSEALAAAFRPGDRLIVVQETGDLLHVPKAVQAIAEGAVSRALSAFHALAGVSDQAITAFFEAFGARLADDGVWQRIAEANEADVTRARGRGRSTTRLVASPAMRKAAFSASLRSGWSATSSSISAFVFSRATVASMPVSATARASAATLAGASAASRKSAARRDS